MSMEARAVDWAVRGAPILRAAQLRVEPGELLGLLGPNGSGKSSLLRLLAGTRAPDGGVVLLDGEEVHRLRPGARALRIAMMQQETAAEADFTVREVVLLGRVPHGGRFRSPDPREQDLAQRALELFGVDALAERRWSTLSGGERQRALLARTVTQETGVLLLDEFTNHLDVRHQLHALEVFAQAPCTVVAALHDLNLAAAYCDRVALMRGGTVVAAGPPADVLTHEAISEVFGAPAEVRIDEGGRPVIRFRRAGTGRPSPAPAPRASDAPAVRPREERTVAT